jgi:B-block binding subunit of TFIIIC.
MSKAAVLRYIRDFPTKARRGFTTYDIAKYTQTSSISVYITIQRLRNSGLIKRLKASKGRGRGRGRDKAIYYFTHNGLIWLRRYNIPV